jgi:phosphate transport system substrate-binding protein
MVEKGRNRLRLSALLVLTLTALPAPAPAGEARTTLTLAGSGTNLPIARVLAAAFEKKHPGIHIEVPASIGSTSGIRAAAEGAVAIGLISRPLKESEKRLGLEVVTYARTPLVIGVHPSVAVESITSAEIIDIYRGKKGSWKDGREIIVLTREPGDSTIEVMCKGVPGFKEVYDESQKAKRWTTLLKDLEMNETLAKTPHAIGFSDLGALTLERHRIKPLKVNGVAPTLKNAENGTYPLVKPLMFVFHREKLPPAAREFLAFTRSKDGAKIMRASGYLPEK